MIIVLILGVLIAILVTFFAFQNPTTVVINLGAAQFEESLVTVLLITLGLGIIISLLSFMPTFIQRGWINSRQKKKISYLETTIDDQEQELTQKSKYIQLLRQNYQEVLHVFSLADSATGFLHPQATITLVTYLLAQIKITINPLCLFMLSVEPAKSDYHISNTEWENSVNRAIARRLMQAIYSNSFLGVCEQQYYVCLALNLTPEKANEYGEYLIGQLTESPLQKADGTTMALKVYIGGAIADPADKIDSHSLLQQAEQNLEQARENKRSSVIITEIVTKLDSLSESEKKATN